MALTQSEFEQLKRRLREQKYGKESTLVEFGKGVVKGLGSSVQGLQDVGTSVAETLLPGYSSIPEEQKGIQTLKKADFTAKNTAQKAGKVTEFLGEILIPFGAANRALKGGEKVLETGSKILSKTAEVTKNAPQKVAKTILGETDMQIVKSGQNPVVELYKSGKKRVSDVVDTVEQAVIGFEKSSKAALQKVKESIPNVPLQLERIATRVNKGIVDSIQHSADYKGINQGFETADDIVRSGILKPEESQRIEKVIEFIGKWKDNSARGVLNLKESLSNFYATGENYVGSNAIIRSIQRNLVDLVGETAPKIKPALKTASRNIDKTEEFIQHLFGKDAVSGETKILQLVRNLSDKAKSGYKIDLVKELEKVSGKKLIPELEGVFDYLQSSKLKFPGLQAPLESLKYFVKKAVGKGVKLK